MPDASQKSGPLSIGFRRGDEYRRSLTVNVDLTGYALTWEIYSLADDVVRASGPLAFTTPPHTVGLVISEAVTAGLLPGTYGFRAEWVATGSVKRTFLEGVAEVTR